MTSDKDYILDVSEDGYGKVLVPRGSWKPSFRRLMQDQQVLAVRLSSAMGWRGTHLDFLTESPELHSLEIYSSEVRDASVVSSFHGLRLLGIDCDLRVPIDFSALQRLEVVKARWVRAIEGVVQCSGLRHLNLTSWPYEDLAPVAHMGRLTRLLLASRKLTSLRGIGELKSLGVVDLHGCPRLASVEGIEACQSISSLSITTCKAVRDISPVGELGLLRELHLDGNGEIESLDPLRRSTLLEKLSFFGSTRIADGRISAIEGLPRLETLRFAPRRHYDRTRGDILGARRAL